MLPIVKLMKAWNDVTQQIADEANKVKDASSNAIIEEVKFFDSLVSPECKRINAFLERLNANHAIKPNDMRMIVTHIPRVHEHYKEAIRNARGWNVFPDDFRRKVKINADIEHLIEACSSSFNNYDFMTRTELQEDFNEYVSPLLIEGVYVYDLDTSEALLGTKYDGLVLISNKISMLKTSLKITSRMSSAKILETNNDIMDPSE